MGEPAGRKAGQVVTSSGDRGLSGKQGNLNLLRDPRAITALAFAGFGLLYMVVNAASLIDQRRALGQRAGLTGTPMILTKDGTQVGGYLPPAQLRATLDRLSGEGAKPAAPAAPADPAKPATGA